MFHPPVYLLKSLRGSLLYVLFAAKIRYDEFTGVSSLCPSSSNLLSPFWTSPENQIPKKNQQKVSKFCTQNLNPTRKQKGCKRKLVPELGRVWKLGKWESPYENEKKRKVVKRDNTSGL